MPFFRNETYVEIAPHTEAASLAVPKSGKVTAVANTHKSAIRIADLQPTDIKKNKAIKPWDLVQNAFPIGGKMNEHTHIFDGTVYKNNNGQARFFMTALPISVSEKITKTAVQAVGNIHRISRLDTIENLIFQKYTTLYDQPTLIIFPQDEGFRILHITNSLPRAAHYISNHPAHKEAEFLRLLNTIPTPEEEPETPTRHAILLTTETSPPEQLNWLYKILSENNFTITEEAKTMLY
jgi:hypothetical protein